MSSFFTKHRSGTRLNIFITISMLCTVAFSLLLAGTLFYLGSARALTLVYRDTIIRRLEQLNRNAREQIVIIDSVYPLFMSNTIIRENLDPAAPAYRDKSPIERRLEIERQMGSLILSGYLWSEGLAKAVYIFDSAGGSAAFSVYNYPEEALERARIICRGIDDDAAGLHIIRSESGGSIYCIRNIFSMYTGEKIAVMLIDINGEKWKNLFSAGNDENQTILLCAKDLVLYLGGPSLSPEEIAEIVSLSKERSGFQEKKLGFTDYFIASRKTGYADLVSLVAAPKQYLLRDMHKTLWAFAGLYVAVMLASLALTSLLGYSVTVPITKMTAYVRAVSGRHTEAKKPEGLFSEFEEFVSAFTEMLERMEMYYTDLHAQQILLKNAEIKALRSQIAPHFLFNVLNTIAWKAEMSGNTEIYRMTISLSELLRANILSNDKDFVTLKEELDYVRFYVQLQQYRFEDKFIVSITHDESLAGFPVPRFSIQALVENAISHGLEPLPGGGKLAVNVWAGQGGVYASVEDNGAGFPEGYTINATSPHEAGTHTGVGLKNLNQRLILLGGSGCGLSICTDQEGRTAVSFKIPEQDKGGA
jgi:sensor histidine kinase YesM